MTKQILVVDVPTEATAEQTEELLNAPCENGYYMTTLSLSWPGVGARGFFKLRAKPKEHEDADQGKTADDIIRANPRMSLRQLKVELARAGIKRGVTWIGEAKARIHPKPTAEEVRAAQRARNTEIAKDIIRRNLTHPVATIHRLIAERGIQAPMDWVEKIRAEFSAEANEKKP